MKRLFGNFQQWSVNFRILFSQIESFHFQKYNKNISINIHWRIFFCFFKLNKKNLHFILCYFQCFSLNLIRWIIFAKILTWNLYIKNAKQSKAVWIEKKTTGHNNLVNWTKTIKVLIGTNTIFGMFILLNTVYIQ